MFGSFQYSNIESMDKKNVDGLHIDYYPLFFDQDTANRVMRTLESIEYLPTFFREADKKLQLCTRGAAWFVDHSVHKSAKDWSYTFTEQQINGLPAIELSGALRDLRDLVSNFTRQKYNAVLVRRLKHGEDYTSWDTNGDPWLGDTFDTPCLSFGCTRTLEFRKHFKCVPPIIHRKDNKNQVMSKKEAKRKNQKLSEKSYRLEHGSLIVMKNPSQRLWQQRIGYDEDCYAPSYHIIFRNVKSNLIHKQYQKYPRIVDRRPVHILEKQWKKDQKIEAKEEEISDKRVYDKTDEGKVEKAVKKESKKAAKGLLDTIGDTITESANNAFNWLAGSPVSKPPKALREPTVPPRTRVRPLGITEQVERQRIGNVKNPIKTITAEQLERQVKEETGRDIHIPYKDRGKHRERNERNERGESGESGDRDNSDNRGKKKTVVVDLTEVPETPVVDDVVTMEDQRRSIRRIYSQLLPVKEIDPDIFDHELQKASAVIRAITTKRDLVNAEYKIVRSVEEHKLNAVNGLKESGLISEREAREWIEN